MKEAELVTRQRRKFRKQTTDSKHNYPVAFNKLNQNFNVNKANQVWGVDMTYISTKEGWLYLAVVMDLYSKRIVGYSMANHMREELPLKALEMAVRARKPKEGLLHHSDRGSQYASRKLSKLSKKISLKL